MWLSQGYWGGDGGLSHEKTPRGWSNERLPLVLRHVTATNEIIDMEGWNLTIGINQVNSFALRYCYNDGLKNSDWKYEAWKTNYMQCTSSQRCLQTTSKRYLECIFSIWSQKTLLRTTFLLQTYYSKVLSGETCKDQQMFGFSTECAQTL